MWRWDGAAWTLHEFENHNPFHLWGTSASRVMTSGNGGAFLYGNGAWTKTEIPRMLGAGQGLWGCTDTFVSGFFAGSFIGHEMLVGRHTGAWSDTGDVPAPNTQVTAITGNANDDVFAGGFLNGGGAAMWHYDGTRWTDIAAPDMRAVLDVVAIGPRQAIAVGSGTGTNDLWRYDGSAWTGLGIVGDGDLSAAAPDDVLLRLETRVMQFDGTAWTERMNVIPTDPISRKSFVGVWWGPTKPYALASDRTVVEQTAAGWVERPVPSDPMQRTPRAIWGTADDDIYVVGDRGYVMHFDGTAWTVSTAASGTDDLTALWGASKTDVYAAAGYRILHWDGTTWSQATSASEQIVGIGGTSATDVWALGERGTVLRWNGTAWDSTLKIPDFPSGLTSFAHPTPTTAFAAGTRGALYRYDGTSWTDQTLPSASGEFSAMWARSATDAYAVGNGGFAYHWDGTAWSSVQPAFNPNLGALSGTATKTIVVGTGGVILVR